MRDWQTDVTVMVHDTEIEMVVCGEWEGADPSVGIMSAGIVGQMLLWQDEKPVEDEVLKIIGEKEVDRVFDEASVKAGEEGPPGPDPDELRDRLNDPARPPDPPYEDD